MNTIKRLDNKATKGYTHPSHRAEQSVHPSTIIFPKKGIELVFCVLLYTVLLKNLYICVLGYTKVQELWIIGLRLGEF